MLSACGLLGCNTAPAQPAVTAAQHAEAMQVFSARCAKCHGAVGKGDGPEGVKLEVRPRNFADPVWHLAVSDRHLEQVIVKGGPSVGKSPLMPAHPDLAARPELLRALCQHLRILAAAPE